MRLGKKGQSAWFDILIIFLCMTIFTGLMWAYTLTAKSPGTNNQARMQSYTQSMLIRTLYSTYSPADSTDTRYEGRSVGDLLSMYLSNPAAFDKDTASGQPKLVKSVLEDLVSSESFQNRPESQLEWFLFEADKKEFCFHITGSKVEDCPQTAVESNAFTSAISELYTAKGSGSLLTAKSSVGGLPTASASGYTPKRIKLTVVWARAA